jgi:hypothetical protein
LAAATSHDDWQRAFATLMCTSCASSSVPDPWAFDQANRRAA